MPEPAPYSYAVVRVVPRVDRGEFINAGIILHCHALRFLGAAIHLDEQRLATFLGTPLELVARAHLDALCAISRGDAGAGAVGALTAQQRFHWLTAPRSTLIQTSPVHSGVCAVPQAQLHKLMAHLVL